MNIYTKLQLIVHFCSNRVSKQKQKKILINFIPNCMRSARILYIPIVLQQIQNVTSW